MNKKLLLLTVPFLFTLGACKDNSSDKSSEKIDNTEIVTELSNTINEIMNSESIQFEGSIKLAENKIFEIEKIDQKFKSIIQPSKGATYTETISRESYDEDEDGVADDYTSVSKSAMVVKDGKIYHYIKSTDTYDKAELSEYNYENEELNIYTASTSETTDSSGIQQYDEYITKYLNLQNLEKFGIQMEAEKKNNVIIIEIDLSKLDIKKISDEVISTAKSEAANEITASDEEMIKTYVEQISFEGVATITVEENKSLEVKTEGFKINIGNGGTALSFLPEFYLKISKIDNYEISIPDVSAEKINDYTDTTIE